MSLPHFSLTEIVNEFSSVTWATNVRVKLFDYDYMLAVTGEIRSIFLPAGYRGGLRAEIGPDQRTIPDWCRPEAFRSQVENNYLVKIGKDIARIARVARKLKRYPTVKEIETYSAATKPTIGSVWLWPILAHEAPPTPK